MTKQIPLTHGKVALVDDADYPVLSQRRWSFRAGYAVRYGRTGEPAIRMHRVILNAPEGVEVDHIDNDGLNNQRSNLRLCNRGQNIVNRRNPKNTSGFRGVSRTKVGGSKEWVAFISVNYKSINLGYYHTPEEAARAYDAAAKKYHGEFARLNFPALEV